MQNLSNAEYAEVASYIALWLAIHGGDPVPDEVTVAQATEAAVQIVRSLSTYVASISGRLNSGDGEAMLEEKLQKVGFAPARGGINPDFQRRCITLPNGATVCILGGPVLQ